MNHSKTPNLWLNKETGSFESLCAIARDEELTFDYDESFDDVHVF
jgi:hypothetical protein